jgi:hypothetical protein
VAESDIPNGLLGSKKILAEASKELLQLRQSLIHVGINIQNCVEPTYFEDRLNVIVDRADGKLAGHILHALSRKQHCAQSGAGHEINVGKVYQKRRFPGIEQTDKLILKHLTCVDVERPVGRYDYHGASFALVYLHLDFSWAGQA